MAGSNWILTRDLRIPVSSPIRRRAVADHIANADGKQLAFLGSQQGNALEQDLAAIYRVGCEYRLTVAVGVSARFPPSSVKPVDTIDLVLYYLDVNQPVDIVRLTIGAKGLSSTQLQDYTVVLATVRPGDAWAGKTIGVAIRATGAAGGFWDLDNVRLDRVRCPTLVRD